VTDEDNHRVQKFTSDGVFITKWGLYGAGDGQFIYTRGITVDALGYVYVADQNNDRVQKFGYLPAFRILAIKDVGNDQGRHARINFLRSSQDTIDSPVPILQYEAYRRIDLLFTASQNSAPVEVKGQPLHPSAMLKDWEFVGVIPAHGEDEYNMIVPTLADSTEEHGIYWSKFFIRAATSSPLVFFDSAVDSGYSVDNLAPAPPLNLFVQPDRLLVWDEAPEPDFDYFSIYGSSSAVFGGDAVMLRQTSTNSFDISAALYPYYYVTATDFNGNESGPSDYTQPTGIGDVPVLKFGLSVAPNPFNPSTMITYVVPKTERVTLAIYDVNGHLVETLVKNELKQARAYQLNYQPETATGVYFVKLIVGEETKTQKIVLLK
jgi:hypothetical protein